ncbi:MAG: hypothetical protein ACE5D7_03470, partial [Fidelibacterota bacterium]
MTKKHLQIIFTLLLLTGITITQENVHFIPNLANTGVSHLSVFTTSVIGVNVGDEIGIFDGNGLLNSFNCASEYGEILVGAGVVSGNQVNISSIGSVDNCSFNGFQLAGYINGHHLLVRIWNSFTDTEFPVHLVLENGSGIFGELFTVVSDIRYFLPGWYGMDPVTPMTIQVLSAEIQGFMPDVGDEIAVYDGEICVGTLKYSNGWESELSLTAGADIPETPDVDGFIQNHEMTFKLWDASDAFEENMISIEIAGDQVFTPNGFSQISISGLSTDDPQLIPDEITIENVYPVPFNSSLNIEMNLGIATHYEVNVFDVRGRKTQTIYS